MKTLATLFFLCFVGNAIAEQIQYFGVSQENRYAGFSRVPLQVIDPHQATIGSEDFRLQFETCSTTEFKCIRHRDRVLASPAADINIGARQDRDDLVIEVISSAPHFSLLGVDTPVTIVRATIGTITTESYVNKEVGIVAYSVYLDDKHLESYVLMSKCGLFADPECVGFAAK